MKWYAKIIKFPGLSTEEYEYRYRCHNHEFSLKFDRHFSGVKPGVFREKSCTGIDLRYRDAVEQHLRSCPSCMKLIPRPWLDKPLDAFMREDLRSLSLWP